MFLGILVFCGSTALEPNIQDCEVATSSPRIFATHDECIQSMYRVLTNPDVISGMEEMDVVLYNAYCENVLLESDIPSMGSDPV